MTAFRIEKLTRLHAVDAFDCGEPGLSRFLTRFAWPSQQASAAPKTIVTFTASDTMAAGAYFLIEKNEKEAAFFAADVSRKAPAPYSGRS